MGIVARVFKEGEEDQTTDYRLHLELMNSGRRRGSDLRLQTTDYRHQTSSGTHELRKEEGLHH